MQKFTWLVITVIAALSVLGCKDKPSGDGGGKVKATLQLNWKPEPEFGGFYAAQESKAFEKQGIDVNVVPGSEGTPTIQMVSAGTVAFGIVSADELLISRARGNGVVALFAVYQTCPQGLMAHASRHFKQIGDIFEAPGTTVAIERGLPYTSFLEERFGFGKVKIVPAPNGGVTSFLNDPNFVQQCFVTSEPLQAKRAGSDPQTFLIADAGYNPYTTVVCTRDDYVKAHPQAVRAMAAACREGWEAYLRDPEPINRLMQKLNPGMDAQTFTEAAAAQRPLIETEQTKQSGVGSMTAERWGELAQQLVHLKVLETAPRAKDCFIDADQLK